MWKDIRKRRGVFVIPRAMLQRDLSLVQKIMSQVIIVRCEHVFMQDRFYYEAYSPLFASLPDNERAPAYDFDSDFESGELICRAIESNFSGSLLMGGWW